MDELSRTIGALGAQIEALKEKLNGHTEVLGDKIDKLQQGVCQKLQDHEKRIRLDERWRYGTIGAGSLGGFLLSRAIEWFHGK
jgi:hypothetical protein